MELPKRMANMECAWAAEGAIGGTAQKIGGPLDKEGMIGKQFTEGGSIGGTVQQMMGGTSKKSN